MAINGYANAYYDMYRKEMVLFTWDDHGNRIVQRHPFKPYLFLEAPSGTDTSIFGTSLVKKEFDANYQRSKFVDTCGMTRIFYNLNPVQQFLIDEYQGLNEHPDFTRHALKIYIFDIEVLSKSEFPRPEEAKYPMNLITVHDSISGEKYTWGLKGLSKPLKEKTNYFAFSSEAEMLKSFISFIQKDYPHIISGWNSNGFDIPYVINRITNVLGEEWTAKLSPVGKVREQNEWADDGKSVKVIKIIEGLHCIDYMEVYKKFGKKRPSYKLDYIGEVEIGMNKLDYGDMSLFDLAQKDWELFTDYNIIDVDILVKLDKKLQYFKLLRMISVIGLTTIQNGLSSLNFITGSLAIFAKNKNLYISTFNEERERGEFEGGYVRDPIVGINEDVVSFDANSLYPNTMITLNTSPETKIGKIVDTTGDVITIKDTRGRLIEVKKNGFDEYVRKNNYALSRAGVLFSQEKKGIMAEMVEYYYKKRVALKAEHKRVEAEYKEKKDPALKVEIERLDTFQNAVKIVINSVYGASGSRFFCFYDLDIAESITATGRDMIKKSAEILDDYINSKLQKAGKRAYNNIVYNDTDSCYVTVSNLRKEVFSVMPFVIDNKINPDWLKVLKHMENHLNKEITQWAKDAINSANPAFEFKREAVCPETIFLAKKKYVLHALNIDGKNEEKWKYVGVEVVQTSMPDPVKKEVKKIIETLLIHKDFVKTNSEVDRVYSLYDNMTVYDYAGVSTANNVQKYTGSGYAGLDFLKGTPYHIKAALAYNHLLDVYGLNGKYEKINSSEKVRLLYVEQPNKFGLKCVGFKHKWPKEFDDIFKPDIDVIKRKQIHKCIERFYEVCGWSLYEPGKKPEFDLFSFLVDDTQECQKYAQRETREEDEMSDDYLELGFEDGV